jgi:hypothetical protein
VSNTRRCKVSVDPEELPTSELGRMWLPSMASPLVFYALEDPALNAMTLDAMIMLAQGAGYRCEPS